MTGSVDFLKFRVEPVELLSEEYDSPEGDVLRRLVIFAQPRTASFTLCRYFAAAGWGLPSEYFASPIMGPLFERFSGSTLVAGSTREDIARYADQLERRRSRNGVFSIKVMWSQMSRFQMGFGSGAPRFNPASQVYLRRTDFESQIVSLVMQQSTGVYSFSARHLSADWKKEEITEEDMIRRAGDYLIKEEKRWFDFFDRFGLRPVILHSEDITLKPLVLMEELSQALGIEYSKSDVLRCAKLEQDGRYENQRSEKRELKEAHLNLLREYSHKRKSQFADLKSHHAMLGS